jgi:hypothetical protein
MINPNSKMVGNRRQLFHLVSTNIVLSDIGVVNLIRRMSSKLEAISFRERRLPSPEANQTHRVGADTLLVRTLTGSGGHKQELLG